jgi:HAD superfamily hydrolase (TIGR01509 family)
MIKGVVFDLDGTLVDSGLDFAAFRASLGLPERGDILHLIDALPPVARARAYDALREFETAGATRARAMPGVAEFLHEIRAQNWRSAVFTRNTREATEQTLQLTGLRVDLIIARDDAPPKPDPTGLQLIAQHWGCAPAELVFFGDYLYDLEAGERAGVPTILYAPLGPSFPHRAKHILAHFEGAFSLLSSIH